MAENSFPGHPLDLMDISAPHNPVDGDRLDFRADEQYLLAQQHSRLVKRLKIALPVLATVLVLGFFTVSWLATQLPEGVSVTSASIEDGKLVMYKPVLTGENEQNQSYEFKAAKALQDLTSPDIIELLDISADIPVSSEMNAKLQASSGFFDRNKQTVRFDKPFRVTTDKGMVADLESADVDIGSGQLTSKSPVRIRTPEASVDAESMRMTDKGNTIILENKVRMTINPKTLDKAGNTGTAN